jgi:Fic family protein
MAAIKYEFPKRWIAYDPLKVAAALTEAKASVISLTTVPYQKAWAEKLQAVQLKSEVAGTSRIEGAEFTENELDAALAAQTPEEALTRSQKQARAAINTYRWIAKLDPERPIATDLILEVHRRIVTGCDDDHCEPGALRTDGNNVTFGNPRHRGANGGKECRLAFAALSKALAGEFREHDILIQALALHYHMGAMHPFLDGNGRTARALEALMLQRSGLRDALFIALSNYYYDEKKTYLKCLSSVRRDGGDMTEFLIFGLKGVALQCRRLLTEINRNISKALFRDVAHDLFDRLVTSRKRVIARRQLAIINLILERGPQRHRDLFGQFEHMYKLKEPYNGYIRDLRGLHDLGAVTFTLDDAEQKKDPKIQNVTVDVRLRWPMEITETEFFELTRKMPRSKNLKYLDLPEVKQKSAV